MKNTRCGFTLPELITASSISIVGLAAIMSVFISSSRAFYAISDSVSTNQQANLTQLRILYDFRSVTKVLSASEQSFSANYIDFGTGDSHVLLYEIRNGGIYKSIDGGNFSLICSDVVTTGTSASKFLYMNQSGSIGSDLVITEIVAAEIYIVPTVNSRQTIGLTRKVNLPFYSSMVQFRNISFK